MSFNAIRKNKLLAKISEFTVPTEMTILNGSRREKTLTLSFLIRSWSYKPAQLQRLVRKLKFPLLQV